MTMVFDALAHPVRRDILELLKGGARSAGALAEALQVPRPTMSAHFAKLRQANLIQADQRGTTIFYSLNLSVLEEALLGFMARVGAGKQEVRDDLPGSDDRIRGARARHGGGGNGGGGRAPA